MPYSKLFREIIEHNLVHIRLEQKGECEMGDSAIAVPVVIFTFVMVIIVVGVFLIYRMPAKERHDAGIYLKDE